MLQSYRFSSKQLNCSPNYCNNINVTVRLSITEFANNQDMWSVDCQHTKHWVDSSDTYIASKTTPNTVSNLNNGKFKFVSVLDNFTKFCVGLVGLLETVCGSNLA